MLSGQIRWRIQKCENMVLILWSSSEIRANQETPTVKKPIINKITIKSERIGK